MLPEKPYLRQIGLLEVGKFAKKPYFSQFYRRSKRAAPKVINDIETVKVTLEGFLLGAKFERHKIVCGVTGAEGVWEIHPVLKLERVQ